MKKVSLTIDGREITANEGEKLLWVALDNDIYIPNLCALSDRRKPLSSCRLCFVEVVGEEEPVLACNLSVADGMRINTRGEKARQLARTAFDLLMASNVVDCGHCAANRACELQVIAHHLRAKLQGKRFTKQLRHFPIDDSSPLFIYNPDRYVLCERCVWVCRERLGIGAIGFAHRGFERMVTTFCHESIGADCRDCRQCVAVCPTGALAFKKKEPTPAC